MRWLQAACNQAWLRLAACRAAAYYTSFASVGLVVYFMRTRKGYRSLPEAINSRYGPLATLSFGAHGNALIRPSRWQVSPC